MTESDDNLPRRRKRFIGRQGELARLDEALEEAPLVTILGAGGMGKTRLAIHYAAEASRFDRVCLCELDEVRSREGLVEAVAEALGWEPGEAGGAHALGIRLAELRDTLLILDNLEQVVEPAADIVGLWLDQAPELQFLATSREPLHLRGERQFELAPLPEEDAISLFAHRARQVRDGFELHERNRPTIARIVRQLDAIPLAVELAAARINVFAPVHILERLQDEGGLEALIRKTRHATVRHQSMHNTLEWSWELLDEAEQRVLAGASVFRGGFDLQAAEEILAPSVEPWIGGVLESLTDKSLLNATRPDDGSGRRFELYETVRQFAARKQERESTGGEVEARHARYYVELFEAAEAAGPVAELGNIKRAFRATVDREPSRAARAAIQVYRTQRRAGIDEDLFEIVDTALRHPSGEPRLTAKLHEARARCHLGLGDYSAAVDDADAGLEAADDESVTRAYLLYRKATARRRQGAPPKAAPLLERALEIVEQQRHARGQIEIGRAAAIVDLERSRLEEARAGLMEALEVARFDDSPEMTGEVLIQLSRCDAHQGEWSAAEERLEEARRLHPGEEPGFRVTWLARRGLLAWARGESERAADWFREGLTLEPPRAARHDRFRLRLGLGNPEVCGGDAEAEEHLRELLEEVWETEDARVRVQVRTRLGILSLRRGEFRDARRFIQKAADEAGRSEEGPMKAHVGCWLAVAEAALGRDERARKLYKAARKQHQKDGAERLADDVDHFECTGELLAEGSGPGRRRVEAMVEELRATSEERRLDRSANIWWWPCYDHRRALVGIVDGVAEAPEAETLAVARDGSTFVLPDGEEVDLSSRQALKRIMAELARRRDDSPVEGASVDELKEIGWPEANLTENSGSSRVYTAIRNLRSMGLSDILLTGRNGYTLDTDLPFRWLD